MKLYDKKHNKQYDNEEDFYEAIEPQMGEKEISEVLKTYSAIDIFDCAEEWFQRSILRKAIKKYMSEYVTIIEE